MSLQPEAIGPIPEETARVARAAFPDGATAMRVMAESYPAWLDALSDELAHRRFTLDEFGTIQLRKRLA